MEKLLWTLIYRVAKEHGIWFAWDYENPVKLDLKVYEMK